MVSVRAFGGEKKMEEKFGGLSSAGGLSEKREEETLGYPARRIPRPRTADFRLEELVGNTV